MVWLVLLFTVQLVLASEKQEGYDVEEGLEKYVRDFMNSYRSIKYLDRAPASPKQARLRAKVKKERKKIRTIKKSKHATKPGKEDQGEVGHRSQAVGHAYELGSYDPFPVWEYSGRTGFEFWPSEFPACGGNLQSPINIDRRLVVHRTLPRLHFHGYSKVTSATTRVRNTGRTLVVELGRVGSSVGRLSGGPLGEDYLLLQVHLHWGSYDGVGAEHTVDRHRYPVEVHLVHIAASLGRGSSAISPREVEEGLVVVAVHLSLEERGSQGLNPLLDSIQYLRPAGPTSVPPLSGFQLGALIRPVVRADYFTYRGSLTTPGCNQVVRWLVMDEQLPISSHQLEQLRGLWDRRGERLVDNYRPVQPLNNRTVELVQQWPNF